MKKETFTFIFFLFVLALVQGQTSFYHAFPDSNAIWREDYNNNPCNCPGNCSSTCGYHNQYYLNGDTIIGTHSYHKLYKKSSYFQSSGTFPTVKSFAGGIRQNIITKKVYFCKPPAINDTLLYDFSLQVGDTLKGYLTIPTPQKVLSIDSTLIGNNYRKRLNFTNGWCIGNYSFIEGIGCNRGLFDECDSFESGGVLNCFMQNGKTLFPDTNTNCNQLLLGIKEIFNNDIGTKINIFPNPGTGKFTFSNIEKGNTIQVFDIIGKLIYEAIAKDNPSIIDLEGKDKGVYTYRVTNSNKEVRQGKLIVK